MSGSTITGLPGAPEVYASAQRTARFPTAQLISLADAKDDGGRGASPLPWSPCGVDEGPRNKRIRQDTCCVHRRRLRGGLHGTHAAAASRVLLLLDDGGGRGGAGHRLVALRAPGFCHCLHGAAASMGVSATETGDAVRGGGMDVSNDARAPLLVELA